MNACGIYEIVSPSGRRYIGSTNNFNRRWSLHRSRLRRGICNSPALQNAWNKYIGALIFRILIICRPEDRIFYEGVLIDGLKPKYNARKASGGGAVKGHAVSIATREKLAQQKGWKHSPEARAKMRRQFTPEHRAKLAAAKTGAPGNHTTPHSAATREAISVKMKTRETPPFWLHRKNLVQS